MPVTSVTATNTTPTSALAPARRSQPSDCGRRAAQVEHRSPTRRGDDEGHVGHPDRRDVHVQDPHRLRLVAVGGREHRARTPPSHPIDTMVAIPSSACRECRSTARPAPTGGCHRPTRPSGRGWSWSSRSCHGAVIRRRAARTPSAPPTPKATAKTASRPTQGQPSDTAAPSVPSAASTARVAPIRTGATAGSMSSGSNVSRPLIPAARPPYSVPTAASPQSR